MKIVTWNLNGIRALGGKDLFSAFVAAYDPDVICLQEPRVQPAQITLDLPSHPSLALPECSLRKLPSRAIQFLLFPSPLPFR